ncbi:MAG TPA: hypothetical protein VFT22_27775, partial [Kofleriaceae bacterium]|nr:hypothetical protein [Kofleriaceae bacterium]
MTLADEIFAATLAMDRAEIKAYELLVDLLGENGCTDWTTDHYDRSIEIFGVAPGLVLSEAQQRALREAGFSRCWTH